MKITPNFLITCQNAFLAAGTNNLNLINIFSAINADKFPFMYPRFALVVNMDIDKPGDHTLNTKVVTPDGRELAKTALPVKVSGTNFQVIANFEGMRFEAPGTYELKVDLDGMVVGSRKLQVNMVVASKAPNVA
jgi:hypothetical protein